MEFNMNNTPLHNMAGINLAKADDISVTELKHALVQLLGCPDLNHDSMDDLTMEAINKAHIVLDI